MQVDSALNTQFLATPAMKSAASEAMLGGNFMDMINAAKQKYTKTVEPAATKDTQSTHDAAYQALLDYMKESPLQHLRDKILKEMNLTEQSLAAMPPSQRSAIEDAIAKKIREYMLTHKGSQQQASDTSKTTNLLLS
jgi:hypothetical protein